MRRQQAGLLQLLADDRITQLPLDEAFRRITEVAGRTLEIERTSVWLFDESRAHIRCHNLYRRSLRQHMAGASLEAAAYPAYFRALETGRSVAVSDAHRDPRTTELAARLPRTARHRRDARGAGPARRAPGGGGLPRARRAAAAVAARREELRGARSPTSWRWRSTPASARGSADRLGRSEERYRTFVNLSTEGILRVEISPPVALEASLEEQVAHIRRHGVVAEANASLAKLLGASSPQRLVGRTLESLVRPEAAEKILAEWIRAGYRFSEYEVDLVGVGRRDAVAARIHDRRHGRRPARCAVEHVAQHHPAQGGGAGARVPGPPRLSHRPAEPQVARRTAGDRARSGAPDRRGPGADDDGPRPLQGDQRLARPLRGRPAAEADRPAPRSRCSRRGAASSRASAATSSR